MCNGDHDFTHWQGVVGIRDMLVRTCRSCGMRDIRILPPDVGAPDTRDRDTFDLWDEEGTDE